MKKDTVLVLGGTGKTGRRIVQRLSARGLPVRVGSRSGEPPFRWEDRSTWAPALEGVTSAYVAYHPDLSIPGAADTVRALAAQAAASGVRRLVLLSGRGEEGALLGEEAVRESGTAWTVLRSSWFCQNFSESDLVGPVRGGEVALPVGNVGEPFVDAEDLADVAVAALTEARHEGRLYELTGPKLLTFAEAVSEIARATGRDIRFVEVTPAQYSAALSECGVPAPVVSLLTYLFTEVLDGRNAHLTDGVQSALGRPPRAFGDYARAAAKTGVWGGASAAG